MFYGLLFKINILRNYRFMKHVDIAVCASLKKSFDKNTFSWL